MATLRNIRLKNRFILADDWVLAFDELVEAEDLGDNRVRVRTTAGNRHVLVFDSDEQQIAAYVYITKVLNDV